MYPLVAKVVGADIYRDGGSLGMFFVGIDGDEYTLFFQIDRAATDDSTTSFSAAFIHQYTRTEYRSPYTGVVTPDWKRQDLALSWSDARALLDQMAGHIQGFATDRPDIFPAMVLAAEVDGNARPLGRKTTPTRNISLERTREG